MISQSTFVKMDGLHWIFTETKNSAFPLPHFLMSLLLIITDRRERDWVLGEFKAGCSPILITTDIASRGLSICFLFLPLSHPCFQRTVPLRLSFAAAVRDPDQSFLRTGRDSWNQTHSCNIHVCDRKILGVRQSGAGQNR